MASDPAREQGSREPPQWVFKAMVRTHLCLNRVTGGRAFNTFGGKPVCFVTMTGAKSGKQLVIPLMYVPHKGGVLLVASKGGAPKNPVWYNNLVKTPDIKVRYKTETKDLRARLASDSEKAGLWPVCDASYPPYADYRARTDRDIPIFVCEPVA